MKNEKAIIVGECLFGFTLALIFLTTVPPLEGHSFPAPEFDNRDYTLLRRLWINQYIISLWQPVGTDSPWRKWATIRREGKLVKKIRYVYEFGPLTGRDITGEGNPDAVIRTYSGGAHCCFGTHLFDLGAEFVEIQVPASPGGNKKGEFKDINGDGIYEFLNYDDSFAYRYCGYAGTPLVKVILEYVPGEGYRPVSPKYSHLYREEIKNDQEVLTWIKKHAGNPAGKGSVKCALLTLVLDYLYSGKTDKGWEILHQHYPYSDLREFHSDVFQVVYSSEYFVLPQELDKN